VWAEITLKIMQQINDGFLVATRYKDGSMGDPIGNIEDGGGFTLFYSLDHAVKIRDQVSIESKQQLHVFKLNIVFAGEVIL
jgi:hypothetical protein